MPTQLKLFSASGSDTLATLEREVNDWLAAKGNNIQPVNSQTTSMPSQALVIALWYLDPPEHH